ncbi:unnamed protein product [Lactuca saligna]|uniref:Uncharacterized protein n=1 Tax=Lactuca saligna TaxID=75948 RepID=A0AA36E468_LACSI|nr:unnamed protein product [Lactuca saligna]
MCAWYRGRKNVEKTRLTGFEGDVEAARAQTPADMDLHHWNVVIDHFLTEKHKKRSAGNKECRKKQYNIFCNVKHNLNRLEAFHHGYVNKKGEFVDHLVEDQYTHQIADSSGDPDTIDWIAIFEKVLGTRRVHMRGLRPKPSSTAATSAQSQ